jgi:hypothetical protein
MAFALFGIGFQVSNAYVTATNAIAVAAGAVTPPFNPAWAWPLITGMTFFMIPLAVIFAKDLAEDNGNGTATATAKPT